MEYDRQKRASKKEVILSRFSDNFRKMHQDGNLLAYMVVEWLYKDVSTEVILEHLIVRDSSRQKIMEDLVEKIPPPPIITTKEHWEEVKKMFPNQQK